MLGGILGTFERVLWLIDDRWPDAAAELLHFAETSGMLIAINASASLLGRHLGRSYAEMMMICRCQTFTLGAGLMPQSGL